MFRVGFPGMQLEMPLEYNWLLVIPLTSHDGADEFVQASNVLSLYNRQSICFQVDSSVDG